MAVGDHGLEVLKKSAEEVTPNNKSDYYLKVKDNAALVLLQEIVDLLPSVGGGGDASAANQLSAIDLLTAIRDQLKRKEAVRFDEVDANNTYFGFADPGSNESAEVWQIMKMTISGNVTSIKWAGGNVNYVNKWSDRTSLTYT